jgi:hypothetical protein
VIIHFVVTQGLAAPEPTRQGKALWVASPDVDRWAPAPPPASLPTRGDDHSDARAVVWDKPSQAPDQLPDNDAAAGCTRPDTHGRWPSLNGFRPPGRAGFTPKR